MRKFMLIAVSVLLTMFLARDARAQTNTHYDYTYYTTANSFVLSEPRLARFISYTLIR